MSQLLHPGSEPRSAADRAVLEPEIHRVTMRETAVITIDGAADEMPAAIGSAILEVEAAMSEAGVGLDGPAFTRYLEMEPRIRAEVGFPVERPAPHVGRVYPGRLPGGRVASVIHVGPFEGLEHTYAALERWLGELGLHASGPMWEVYWSDPEKEPDPATWRTEIVEPLE